MATMLRILIISRCVLCLVYVYVLVYAYRAAPTRDICASGVPSNVTIMITTILMIMIIMIVMIVMIVMIIMTMIVVIIILMSLCSLADGRRVAQAWRARCAGFHEAQKCR